FYIPSYKICAQLIENKTGKIIYRHITNIINIDELDKSQLNYLIILTHMNFNLVLKYVEVISEINGMNYDLKYYNYNWVKLNSLNYNNKRKVEFNYQIELIDFSSFYHVNCAVDDNDTQNSVIKTLNIEKNIFTALNKEYDPPFILNELAIKIFGENISSKEFSQRTLTFSKNKGSFKKTVQGFNISEGTR
ncbi:hypothetical protein MXB_2422, partial [Myxobolus squamalis]